MPQIFGELLPTALGIAISPIPIVATILLLLTPKSRSLSVSYLIGWLAGIIVATGLFALIGGSIPESDPNASKPIVGVIQLVLGVLAIFFAIKQWQKRPRDGETPAAPKWMAQLEKLSPLTVLGIGAALAAGNPKNLILAASAGITIGTADATLGQTLMFVGFVALIGGAVVLVLVIANLLWAKQLERGLVRLRDELQRNNAVIMAVVLLLIGAQVIGKAFGQF